MCGIIGFIAGNKLGHVAKLESVVEQLLWSSALRGYDSTGLFIKSRGERDTIYHKKALNSADFLQTSAYQKGLKPKIWTAEAVVGHTRSATRGSCTDANAHPFMAGDFTVVHNGHISNYNSMTKYNHDVDSECVPYAMDEEGETATLEKLRGAFCLVWHNAKDGTINIARNGDRPMVCAYIKDKPLMFFASEMNMLYWILERNDLEIEGKFKIITPYQQFKFKQGEDPRGYSKLPFAEPKSSHRVIPPGPAWNRGGPIMDRPPEKSTTTGQPSGTTMPAIPVIEETQIDNIVKMPNASQRHRPTTKKKKEAVARKLKRHGYNYDGVLPMFPDTFSLYRNQKDRGVINGTRLSNINVQVEIPNVSRNIFNQGKSMGKLYVRVINVREKGKSFVLIGELDEAEHKDCLMRHSIPSDKGEVDTEAPLYRGPRGALVNLRLFREYMRKGCAWCSEILRPDQHAELHWIHQMSEALCPSCSKNAEVMDTLGIKLVSEEESLNESKAS